MIRMYSRMHDEIHLRIHVDAFVYIFQLGLYLIQ